MTAFAQGDEDIRRILTGENQQETMLGVDAPNAQALDEIRQFMEVRERQHIAVTVGEIQRRYQAAPYGWREIDVAALIAEADARRNCSSSAIIWRFPTPSAARWTA